MTETDQEREGVRDGPRGREGVRDTETQTGKETERKKKKRCRQTENRTDRETLIVCVTE